MIKFIKKGGGAILFLIGLIGFLILNIMDVHIIADDPIVTIWGYFINFGYICIAILVFVGLWKGFNEKKLPEKRYVIDQNTNGEGKHWVKLSEYPPRGWVFVGNIQKEKDDWWVEIQKEK